MIVKVTLRNKPITGNRLSLYLDFYPPIVHPDTKQSTRRHFLGIYIPEKVKNPLEKAFVKEKLLYAEQLRQQWENKILKSEIYSDYENGKLREKEKGQKNFIEYYKIMADKRKKSNHDNWISAYKYLLSFAGEYVKFNELNEEFCNEFKDFLLTTKSNKSQKVNLAQNSAVSYFNKIKAALKQAYKDGYLQYDLNSRVEPIPQAETQRNFLTIEELNALNKTECQNPLMKKAAMFSALTGLRFSDIHKMIWKEVEFINGNGYFINFKQRKTKGVEMLPISEQAYSFLGEPREPDQRVFEGLEYSAYHNKHLYQWIGAAGITKDITFHCFRHTYATLQLSNGTDIYTVSKLLGHRELKTTQIYARVVDKAKRDAADRIKLDL